MKLRVNGMHFFKILYSKFYKFQVVVSEQMLISKNVWNSHSAMDLITYFYKIMYKIISQIAQKVTLNPLFDNFGNEGKSKMISRNLKFNNSLRSIK